MENWPEPDPNLENSVLEEEFDILLKTLPVLYSARQNAKLKRRWPLAKAIVVASKKNQQAIKKLETLFFELGNIKVVEYKDKDNIGEIDSKKWVMASDNEISIILDMNRDDALKGEGLMRDLARRVQSLRKDLGFSPTDIVNVVHVADLDPEDIKILSPFIDEMEELVRAKKVNVHQKKIDINADWNETKLDKKKVHVAVI